MEDLAKRAQALKEAIQADGAFKDAIEKAMQAGDAEAAVKLAADKGIEFAVEELAPAALLAADGKELDDSELEAVAGGSDWFTGPECPVLTGV